MTLFTWSKTAASNNTADPTVNFREGQAPSTVNNSTRAAMAAVAKYRDDIAGMIDTGGSSTAFTVTTNQGYTSLADGISVTVRLHAANGASPTLNVDSLGAKAIRTHTGTAIPSAAMNSGGIYKFTYDLADDCWYLAGFFAATDTDFADDTFFVSDQADATKKLAFQLSGVTTATTRTMTVPDASGTLMLTSALGVTALAVANNLSDVASAVTAFSNIKQAASDSATGVLEIAVQSEMEAASSTTLAVTPGRQRFHPGHPKAGGNLNGEGTPAFVTGDVGMGAVTDDGVGLYTLALDTAFANTNYWITGWARDDDTAVSVLSGTAAGTKTTSSFQVKCRVVINADADSPEIGVMFWGDYA